MEKACAEKLFHERDDAADFDKFGHEEASARFEIREDRNLFSDEGEIVDCELHACRMRDGEQMEHRVRRTAERDRDGDRILECLLRKDVGGPDALFQKVDDRRARIPAILRFVGGNRSLCGTVGEAESHGLNGGCHGVRGIHSAAGAGAGDRAGFHVVEFPAGNFVRRPLSHCLKDRNHIEVFPSEASRQDCASVNKHGCPVQARNGDHATRHIFVAAPDRDKSIEALTSHDCLDRIRDHLA